MKAIERGSPAKASLLLLIGYLVFGILQAPSYPKIDPEWTVVDALVGIALFALLLLPAAFTGARLNPDKLPILNGLLGHRLRAKDLASKLLPAILLAFVAFSMNAFLSASFSALGSPPTSQDYILQFTLVEKIAASASSGIWEETIFRLFIISAVLIVMRSRTAAAIISNLLFAAMHVVFQQPPYNLPALVIVFVIGLVYTRCFFSYGLESSVVCHAAMNLLAMTLGLML